MTLEYFAKMIKSKCKSGRCIFDGKCPLSTDRPIDCEEVTTSLWMQCIVNLEYPDILNAIDKCEDCKHYKDERCLLRAGKTVKGTNYCKLFSR